MQYTDPRLHPQSYYELGLKGVPALLTHDTITSIAKKHNKSMYHTH